MFQRNCQKRITNLEQFLLQYEMQKRRVPATKNEPFHKHNPINENNLLKKVGIHKINFYFCAAQFALIQVSDSLPVDYANCIENKHFIII